MYTLAKTGQRIGVDYDEAMLAAYVGQQREGGFNARFAALKPEAGLKMALPHLKALVASPEGLELLEKTLGVDFDAIWRPINTRAVEKYKARKTKEALKPPAQGQGQGGDDREENGEREPLSPFRFQARR
jgi:hypothetical protein